MPDLLRPALLRARPDCLKVSVPVSVSGSPKSYRSATASAPSSTKLAIERSGITRERVANELGRIGFANMMDYMRIDPATGEPRIDWSDLTREQAAALTEVTVDDYLGGRGAELREVRKVKFKLGDKRAALMDIAKLFGWVVEKRENKIVDEFDTMTDEQGRVAWVVEI